MFASRLFLLTTLVACTMVPATNCWAQAYGLEGLVENNDLQWFEPLSLDLDGQSETEAGYFFRYTKEGSYVSGERVEIGDPDTVVFSEQVYGDVTVENRQKLVTELYINNPTLDILEEQVEFNFGITFQEVGGNVVTVPIDVAVDDGNGGTVIVTVEVPQVDTVTVSTPDAYQVRNSILDGTPKAELGWGEEYAFGYSDGERGWLVRFLDGVENNTGGSYGAGIGNPYTSQSGTGFADFDPFYGATPVDANGDNILDAPIGPNDIYALGFGSVAVNFAAPDDFFVGLRNYQINGDPSAGTQYGPIYYIGNQGSVDDDNDPTDDVDVPGVADDLNGNGGTFFLVLADLNGDGTIDDDEFIGTLVDFGDLYKFNVFFDRVNVRNRVEMDGLDIMFTHELDRSHKLDRGRRDKLQLRYGATFLRFSDEHSMEGLGSILGRTFVDHETDNQLVGPQVGLRWTRDHGKWDFSLDGQVAMAYNIVDHRQSGIFGEELIPGALNRPINGRTTTSVDSLHNDDFSPMAELRVEARYKITSALALKIGYKARFIDNIHRASDAVGYTAPYWSIKEKKSDVFINGITLGVEFRH